MIYNQNVKITKLTPTAKIPVYAHEDDAGADLYADIEEEIVIQPNTKAKIPTGIAVAIPVGMMFGVFPKSGMSNNDNFTLQNCVGVIDTPYRGEISVLLRNEDTEPKVIKPGQKIAQLVLMPIFHACFIEVDELDKADRGTGGFGSTGLE